MRSGRPLLGTAAVAGFVAGRPGPAAERARAALAAEESGAARAVIARRAIALVTYGFMGDVENGLERLDEVIAAARDEGVRTVELEMRVLRSQALTAAGRADEGLAEAEAARADAERLASPYMLAWCQYILGTVLVARGDERAEHSLSESLRWGRSGDFYLVIGSSLRELGALALRAGREEEAALRFGEAFEHFARPGDCPQVWDVLRAAAPLFVARGRRERAAQILAGADADTRARRPAPLAAPRVSALRAELAAELEQAAAAPQILEELAPQLAAELEQIAAGAPAAPARGRRRRGAGRRGPALPPGGHAVDARLRRPGGAHARPQGLARPRPAAGRARPGAARAGAGRGAGRGRRSAEASGEGLGVQGHAGELLDERARAEYRERIRDLSEEAERAAAAGDDEGAERAREELDQLTAALAAAFGLGGRARKSGDPAERARSAVTWRIRSALTKIEQAHPPLGRHLRNSIRTGLFCAYVPERPLEWDT